MVSREEARPGTGEAVFSVNQVDHSLCVVSAQENSRKSEIAEQIGIRAIRKHQQIKMNSQIFQPHSSCFFLYPFLMLLLYPDPAVGWSIL